MGGGVCGGRDLLHRLIHLPELIWRNWNSVRLLYLSLKSRQAMAWSVCWCCRTVWYELQAREWPFKNQPAEALIWQIGSGEGVKQVLATVSLGKEVNVSTSVAAILPYSYLSGKEEAAYRQNLFYSYYNSKDKGQDWEQIRMGHQVRYWASACNCHTEVDIHWYTGYCLFNRGLGHSHNQYLWLGSHKSQHSISCLVCTVDLWTKWR